MQRSAGVCRVKAPSARWVLAPGGGVATVMGNRENTQLVVHLHQTIDDALGKSAQGKLLETARKCAADGGIGQQQGGRTFKFVNKSAAQCIMPFS